MAATDNKWPGYPVTGANNNLMTHTMSAHDNCSPQQWTAACCLPSTAAVAN